MAAGGQRIRRAVPFCRIIRRPRGAEEGSIQEYHPALSGNAVQILFMKTNKTPVILAILSLTAFAGSQAQTAVTGSAAPAVAPPANTTTPAAWSQVTVSGSNFKVPLYQ